jgi:O-antigen ligase
MTEHSGTGEGECAAGETRLYRQLGLVAIWLFYTAMVVAIAGRLMVSAVDQWGAGATWIEVLETTSWHLPPRVLWPSLAGVVAMTLAPWRPMVGLLVFTFVAYGSPRVYGFGFFCRWGVLEAICGLAALATLIHLFGRSQADGSSSHHVASNGPGSMWSGFVRFVRDPIGRLMIALVAWVMVSASVAFAGGNYEPAANHHPKHMVDNLLLMSVASVCLRGPAAWYVLATTLGFTLAQRVHFAPELLKRNGDLGVLLAVAIPLSWSAVAACGWRFPKHWWRRSLRVVAGLVAAVMSLWLTGLLLTMENRGGVVAFASAGLVALVLFRRRMVALGIFCAVLVAGAVYADQFGFYDRFIRIQNPDSGDRATVESRMDIYVGGLRMAAAHPWFGVGLGNFEPRSAEFTPTGRDDTSHNNVIGMFAETGVIGGLLYVVLFGWGWFRFVRVSYDAETLAEHLVLVGAAAALVAYMMGGMFMTRHTFWFAFLLLGGSIACRKARAET